MALTEIFPEPVPGALHVLSLLTLTGLGGRCYSYSHFTDACIEDREVLGALP